MNFQEAIQHSIAVDCYSATLIGPRNHHNSSDYLPCRPDANCTQVSSTNDDGRGGLIAALPARGGDVSGDDGLNCANPNSGEKIEGVTVYHAQEPQENKGAFVHPRNQPSGHSGVGVRHYDGLIGDTNDHHRARDGAERITLDKHHAGAATDDSPTNIGFDGPIAWATCKLTSDLGRLASRQREAACKLLLQEEEGMRRETVSTSREALPHACEVVAALGHSVGLQAKAVGLMEEVVTRTLHSRVSQRDVSTLSCVVLGRNGRCSIPPPLSLNKYTKEEKFL